MRIITSIKFSFVHGYNVKQIGVTIEFYGDEHNEVRLNDPTTVKKYVRSTQLGKILN